MEYASNARGNLELILGAIGTGLSVLSGGLVAVNGLNTMMNGGTGATGCMLNSNDVDMLHMYITGGAA